MSNDAQEVINLEGDAAFGQQSHTESQTEQDARRDGWLPQEEWEGDSDEWVPAKEFNFRGSLMKRIQKESKNSKQLRQELDQVRMTMKQLADHNKKLAAAERQEMIDDLNDIRKEAMESQDFDRMVKAEEKIKEVENLPEEIPDVEEAPPQEHPAVAAWREENDWYDADPVMAGAADALAIQLRNENPNWEAERLLEALSSEMDSRFFGVEGDEEDEAPKPKPRGRARTSEPARQGKRSAANTNLTGKLTADQRRIGETFVRDGAIDSLQEYAKQLREIGEI